MKQEPPSDARCRDKFLVQSVTITGDKEFTNVSQIVGIPCTRVDEPSADKYVTVGWCRQVPDSGEEDSRSLASGLRRGDYLPCCCHPYPPLDLEPGTFTFRSSLAIDDQTNNHMRRLRKLPLPSHLPARPDLQRPTPAKSSKSPTSPITSSRPLWPPHRQYRTRPPRRTSS